MKKLLPFFTFLLLSYNATFGHEYLKTQLEHLNETWKVKELPFDYDFTSFKIKSDEDLIQLHLLMVQHELKKNTPFYLSPSQKNNRLDLLKQLKTYANNKVFPKNLDYTYRIPYFIDEFDNACAVGQLIINSGSEPIARKIQNESNNLYLKEMNYPEIAVWATKHGFSIDELKWIQPSYGPTCAPGQVVQPICSGNNLFFNLGCFNPDWQSDGLIAPVEYKTEFNDGNGWQVDSNNTWQFMGAMPGQYKITVTDSNNISMVYNYTIIAPPALTSNDSIINNSTTANSCDGSLKITPANGTPPYNVRLMNTSLPYGHSDSSGRFNNLCPATYTYVINDANNCQSSGTISVLFGTGIKKEELTEVLLIQNPMVNNRLDLQTSLKGIKTIRVMSLKGNLLLNSKFSASKFEESIDFDNGLYILELSNSNVSIQRKIIISN